MPLRARPLYSVRLAAVVCLTGLSACAQESAPAETPAAEADSGETSVYVCGGKKVTVSPLKAGAELVLDGQTYQLEQQTSASGARYETPGSDPYVLFWNKGSIAMLEAPDGPYPTCRLTDDLIPYRALGQEPGWLLEVSTEGFHLLAQYGEIEVSGAAPEVSTTNKGHNFTASAGGYRIKAVIAYSPCHDIMSGEPFPHTVSLTYNGTTVNGCGEPSDRRKAEENSP